MSPLPLTKPDISLAAKWWENYYLNGVTKILGTKDGLLNYLEDGDYVYDTDNMTVSGGRDAGGIPPHPEDAIPLVGTVASYVADALVKRADTLIDGIMDRFTKEMISSDIRKVAWDYRDAVVDVIESLGSRDSKRLLDEAMGPYPVFAALVPPEAAELVLDKREAFEWMYDLGLEWDDLHDPEVIGELQKEFAFTMPEGIEEVLDYHLPRIMGDYLHKQYLQDPGYDQ